MNKEFRSVDGTIFHYNPDGLLEPIAVQEGYLQDNKKELLKEFYPLLLEGVQNNDPNKPLIVKAVLQRANAKNQNGRVYPKEILIREAEKYNSMVKQRRAVGELDHPESSVVELQNCSHIITEIHWEGDDLVGSVEVLPTPKGNILKQLLLSNVAVGISSRGLGNVVKKQTNEGSVDVVADSFELLAFDVVSNPSTDGAFLHESKDHQMNESVQSEDELPILNKEQAFELYKKCEYDYLLKSKFMTDEKIFSMFR